MVDLYEEAGINENNAINLQPNGLTVILFVGVNGVGKTTSIGKLAHQYKLEGKKVLMAAADTFRAGAIDQLVVWGERAGVEVVRGMLAAIQQRSFSMQWNVPKQNRPMFC